MPTKKRWREAPSTPYDQSMWEQKIERSGARRGAFVAAAYQAGD
jgi:hypothetical protein